MMIDLLSFLCSEAWKCLQQPHCISFSLGLQSKALRKRKEKRLTVLQNNYCFFFRTFQIWKMKRNNCTGELTECRKRYSVMNENQDFLCFNFFCTAPHCLLICTSFFFRLRMFETTTRCCKQLGACALKERKSNHLHGRNWNRRTR